MPPIIGWIGNRIFMGTRQKSLSRAEIEIQEVQGKKIENCMSLHIT